MFVRAMTVDGDFELYKIHKHYPAAEWVSIIIIHWTIFFFF